MAEVINLAERKPIPPKEQSFEHGGQRYTCRFDPNAPEDKRWLWTLAYTRVYRYYGQAPTMEQASAVARRKIHSMNKFAIQAEEDDVSRG